MNINGMASALSGLKASSIRMDVSAHNVANSNTDSFKKEIITQQSDNGIVQTTITKDNTPGPKVQGHTPQGAPETIELSNVDISQEVGDQIIAHNNYAANVKTIQTQDELLGTIIDLKK